jgi:Protein of unknown function/Domain of unknown function (DUF1835)
VARAPSRSKSYPLHVLFSGSAAGSVTMSLRFPGRPLAARVIWLEEPFELGPIAPADPQRRAPWFRAMQMPRYAGAREIDRYWRRICEADWPIVWASHRSARELGGLMELAWRRRRPFRLVDVAADRRLRSQRLYSTGYVRHQTMVDLQLGANARSVEQAEVDALAASWEALAREPEPMRIVTAHGLLAVPLSHFDDAIIEQTPTTTWTRAIVVVGQLLGECDLTGFAQFADSMLARRIDTLLDAGLLESDNIDAANFRALRIRRPS